VSFQPSDGSASAQAASSPLLHTNVELGRMPIPLRRAAVSSSLEELSATGSISGAISDISRGSGRYSSPVRELLAFDVQTIAPWGAHLLGTLTL